MKVQMTTLKAMSLAVAMAVFGTISTAEAHHSAAYIADFTKQIQVKGVLRVVKFINPHCEFHVDSKGADGKTVSWSFEGPPPVFFRQAGLKKEDFARHIGEEVTVTTFANKMNAPMGFFKKVVYKDGTSFEMDFTPDR